MALVLEIGWAGALICLATIVVLFYIINDWIHLRVFGEKQVVSTPTPMMVMPKVPDLGPPKLTAEDLAAMDPVSDKALESRMKALETPAVTK